MASRRQKAGGLTLTAAVTHLPLPIIFSGFIFLAAIRDFSGTGLWRGPLCHRMRSCASLRLVSSPPCYHIVSVWFVSSPPCSRKDSRLAIFLILSFLTRLTGRGISTFLFLGSS